MGEGYSFLILKARFLINRFLQFVKSPRNRQDNTDCCYFYFLFFFLDFFLGLSSSSGGGISSFEPRIEIATVFMHLPIKERIVNNHTYTYIHSFETTPSTPKY